MAGYKRKYTKKHTPRGGRAKSYFGRSISTGFKLAKLAAQVYTLKGLVNSEMFYKITGASNSVSSSGMVVPITGIDIGDGPDQRTGNSILARSLNIRYNLTKGTNVSANNTIVRLMIIQDTQQIGDTTPSITDIFESDVMSGLKTTTAGRFKVMWSKMVTLTATIKEQEFIQVYKKLYTHIKYNGSATTDIQKGGLYFVGLSNMANTSGIRPECAYNIKLGYHDN